MTFKTPKILLFLALFSTACRTPQSLVDKAISKDSEVLKPYIRDAVKDLDTSCIEQLNLNLTPIYPKITISPLRGVISTIQENRTERTRLRQENRTYRNDSRQVTNIAQDIERTSRAEIRQDNRTDRQLIKFDFKSERQRQRTKRGLGFWITAVIASLLVGYFYGRSGLRLFRFI